MQDIIRNEEIQTLPLLALRGLTVFPDMVMHFDVGRAKSIKALETAMKSDQLIFLVAQRDIRTDDPSRDELYEVGTVSRIKQFLKLPGDSIRVMVEGIARAKLLSCDETPEGYITAGIFQVTEIASRATASKTEALIRSIQEAFDDYASLFGKLSGDILLNVMEATSPGYLADYLAQNIPVKYTMRQVILEEFEPVRRLELMLSMLFKEIEILELEQNISSKVKEQIDKNQKEYYLREQIKAIQTELGEREDTYSEAEDYRERILALHLPDESEEKLIKETVRLSRTGTGSPEGTVIRTYLDTCLELPWIRRTRDRLDIDKTLKILDADHYGLEKVKERILEYLAVKKLAPEAKSQILCLVGPPGVGKTSIGMSIARAMNRKLSRVSLGGVRDEADIRGHRKTYIGAMPGRIINALRQSGSKNALILLDEIDKLGHDFRGDPAAALLEVLDAEQNHAFRDHYIEIPFDLSEVLFITTANTTQTIPRALLDRMEVIELSSYTNEEKVSITRRHLLPKQQKQHGLSRSTLSVSDDALREIIDGYTREAGVRSLERSVAAICRKAAKMIASGEKKKVSVRPQDIRELLGPRKFKPDANVLCDEVGVANGLAWTSVGGELLEVEVNVVEGSGKLELTGNLGDVMKESAKAAITYIRSRLQALEIDKDFYKTRDIHIHFPESAVPKDGPSAGITMAVALISALTGAPVRRTIAMTGEITLRGRVLPIGGLKEKTMAAYKNGIKTVILPLQNEADLDEIDKTVHAALQFVPVDHIDRVIELALDMSRRPTPAPAPETKEMPAAAVQPAPGECVQPAIQQ